jgi:hypothetical protein
MKIGPLNGRHALLKLLEMALVLGLVLERGVNTQPADAVRHRR